MQRPRSFFTTIITSVLCTFPLFSEVGPESVPLSFEEELSLIDKEFEELNKTLTTENPIKLQEIEISLPIAQEDAPASQELSLSPVLGAASEATSTEEVLSTPTPDFSTLTTEEPTTILERSDPLTGQEHKPVVIDFTQAFLSAPLIYSLLLGMSIFAFGTWIYSLLSIRQALAFSPTLARGLQNKLNSNQFEEALTLCSESENLFGKMVTAGIHSRGHGPFFTIEAMKAEGKRGSISFWQTIGLLNDVAIIAPLVGLLGTVLGMFYAFYDVNRSMESIATLFDGLGVSVGTTVAGLSVAILALILHSTAKHRLVRALATVENEVQGLANLIDDRTSVYRTKGSSS